MYALSQQAIDAEIAYRREQADAAFARATARRNRRRLRRERRAAARPDRHWYGIRRVDPATR
jgi:hypothetical protein